MFPLDKTRTRARVRLVLSPLELWRLGSQKIDNHELIMNMLSEGHLSLSLAWAELSNYSRQAMYKGRVKKVWKLFPKLK